MSTGHDIVIVGAARTPFGKFLGQLSSLPVTELGSWAIRGAVKQSGISPCTVDAVIMGQVLQAGAGQNPTKQAALGAGITPKAHTTTVNKVCLSGLSSIIDAARLLRSKEAQVVVAGGMESMSLAPHLLSGSRRGRNYGSWEALDHVAYDGLRSADLKISMGELSEKFADRYPVTRADQDRCAALSHQRALHATESGLLSEEITPVLIQKRKEQIEITRDEGIRTGVCEDSLAHLKPAFTPDGCITAGNASPLSDGAAAVVLCTRSYAQEHGLPVLATLRAAGQIAGEDSSLHSRPAEALQAALNRQGWRAKDLDLIEINEAFAAVVVHSARVLGVDPTNVNVCGGAIALGHPIGASGARLVVHAAHQLKKNMAHRAGVALCGGGGQGEALLLEN